MDTIHFSSEDRLFLKRPDRDRIPAENMVPAGNPGPGGNGSRDDGGISHIPGK